MRDLVDVFGEGFAGGFLEYAVEGGQTYVGAGSGIGEAGGGAGSFR